MNYKIIDNALPQKQFKDIKDLLINLNFPWNLTTSVVKKEENLPIVASYYFTHNFWERFHIEPQARVFAPILDILECKSMLRIKANLYPSTETIMHHDNHRDYDYPHKGAIYYLNTNNGITVLENKIEVNSVENRLLIFDPFKPHHSTTCTDDKCRMNVNFNYF